MDSNSSQWLSCCVNTGKLSNFIRSVSSSIKWWSWCQYHSFIKMINNNNSAKHSYKCFASLKSFNLHYKSIREILPLFWDEKTEAKGGEGQFPKAYGWLKMEMKSQPGYGDEIDACSFYPAKPPLIIDKVTCANTQVPRLTCGKCWRYGTFQDLRFLTQNT